MRNLSKSVLGTVAAVALTASAAFATVPAQQSCSYVFNTNMKLGAVSSDVMNLQKLLNMDVRTQVSASGAGSTGFETSRFGPATFAAVKKFQAANGVSPVSGFAGPLTRAMLNSVCNGTTSTSTGNVTTGSGVVSNNIPVSVLVQGQAGAKLAEFAVSGNGTVNNITLQRTGLSNNDTLANVYLYDGMTRLTDANSVRQDGSISFNNPYGLFQVNGSKTITVKADIKSTLTSGQTVGVAMTGLTMMGATSTPVTGAQGPLFSISSASTATVNVTSQTVTDQSSVNIPRTNYTVWSINPSVSTNAVNLKGLTLEMIGSADVSALSNIRLFVNGTQAATANISVVSGTKRVSFDLSSNPKLLATAGHIIEVRADIVSGATRDFKMSLANTSDIVLEDVVLTGVGVTPTFGTYNPGSGTQSTRIAGKQTLTGASNTSVNVFKDTTYTVTNITPGASNVTLAKYKLTAYGEDTKVQTVKFSAPAAAANVGNVTLYVNGAQVGNTITGGLALTNNIFNLGSNFIAMPGTEYVVEIKGNASHYSTGAAISSGTFILDITSVEGIGQFSQSSFTNSTTVNGQSMTFGGGNFAVGNVVSGFNSTVSPNASDAKIGSFSIQAGVTESADVRTFAFAIGGSGSATFLSNVRLVDAVTGASIAPAQPGNASITFSPSASFIVPAGQTRTVNLIANTGNQTAGLAVIPTMTITGYGSTSNQLLTFTGNTLAGTTVNYQSVTVGTPSCTSVIAAQTIVGGSSLSSVCVLNFTSANGNASINDLTFTVSGVTTPALLAGVESITINNVTVVPVGSTVTFSGLNLPVTSGTTGVNYPVTVKYSSAYVGSGSGVVSGGTAGIQLTSMKATPEGGSPSTTSPNIPATVNLMTLRASVPTVVKGISGGTYGVNGAASGALAVKLGQIKVSADAKGDIVVGAFSLNATAPGTVSAIIAKIDGQTAQDKLGANVTCTTTVCTFAAGYRISAGETKTFDIFGTVAATTASGNLDVTVGAAGSFTWSDDVSTNGSALFGTVLPSSKYQQ